MRGLSSLVFAVAVSFVVAGCGNGTPEQMPDSGIDPNARPDAGNACPGCDASMPDVRVPPDAAPPAHCGDGHVDADEQCDDGNTTAGDGCSATCTNEPVCGNATLETGEGCDDGNRAPGDGCSASCTSEALCGDGHLDTGEQCDDGASNSDTTPDACRADCSRARCGDGVTDTGEACDDGAGNSNTAADACRTSCQRPSCGDAVQDSGEACDTGSARSDTTPDACRTSCVAPRCGDAVQDTGEACDDGNGVDTDSCRNTCGSASCGDGHLDAGEQCDDGNNTSGDGCQATCLLPVCGDGTTDMAEACDDGNVIDGDGCQHDCTRSACLRDPDCSDGVFCDGAEVCTAGVCQPGTGLALDDGIACTHDMCDEATQTVLHRAWDPDCAFLNQPDMCTAAAPLGVTHIAGVCNATMGCIGQTVPVADCTMGVPGTSCTGTAAANNLTYHYAQTPTCTAARCGYSESTTACGPTAHSCSAARDWQHYGPTCAASGGCGNASTPTVDGQCWMLDVAECPTASTFHRAVGVCTAAAGCSATHTNVTCNRGSICYGNQRYTRYPYCEVASPTMSGCMDRVSSACNNSYCTADQSGIVTETGCPDGAIACSTSTMICPPRTYCADYRPTGAIDCYPIIG